MMSNLQLLEECNYSKLKLAEELGISVSSVYGWRDKWPKYATAYLKEVILRKKLQNIILERMTKDIGSVANCISLKTDV